MKEIKNLFLPSYNYHRVSFGTKTEIPPTICTVHSTIMLSEYRETNGFLEHLKFLSNNQFSYRDSQ